MKKKPGRPKKEGNSIFTAAKAEEVNNEPMAIDAEEDIIVDHKDAPADFKDIKIAELEAEIVLLKDRLAETAAKVEEPRQWMYHANKPEGEIFAAKEAEALMKDGWVKSPKEL